jgi:hypothetical protein
MKSLRNRPKDFCTIQFALALAARSTTNAESGVALGQYFCH